MAAGKRIGKKSQASNDFLEPLAPTSVVGTNVGTNRPFNDGAVSVAFSLPALSPTATSFTVTASTGQTATGASSPIIVTGIASNAAPTFTVRASNAAGTSAASAASSAVTVTTVPATPAAPTVSSPTPSAAVNTAGTTTDNVSWLAPANGGSAIIDYTWASSDGKGATQAGTSVSVNQEGGTSQTYTVRARNANGLSAISPASVSVTTFSFTPYSFTPYAFTPYAFTPVYSFTPYAFTPYAFVPYSFVPFSFVPYAFTPAPYSFTPYAFTPYSFVPYAFTPSYSFVPLTVCIDEDTRIQVIGKDDSVESKAAKDIVVGDKIWSINWNGLLDESVDPSASTVYPGVLEGVARVPSEIIAIKPSVKDQTLFFNGDIGKRFTAEEKVLIKRLDSHIFVEAKTVTLNDFIFEATDNGMIETPVISVDYIDETRNVFKFNAFPIDTIIAGNMVVHNSKV
jgi:hypothetical protein